MRGELVQGHLVKWPDHSHAQSPGLTHNKTKQINKQIILTVRHLYEWLFLAFQIREGFLFSYYSCAYQGCWFVPFKPIRSLSQEYGESHMIPLPLLTMCTVMFIEHTLQEISFFLSAGSHSLFLYNISLHVVLAIALQELE